MDLTSLVSTTATWDPTLKSVLPYVIKGGGAIIVMLIALTVAERARRATVQSVGRTKADPSTAVFVGRITHLGALIIGVLIALGILGISWTALLAVVGAVSLAISLAIQDVLKNFVAGLYLLIERPFRVGDTIKIKDFTGRVEDVGIRTTVLRTSDGLQVVVPNAIMFAEVVVNMSASKVQVVEASEGEEKPAMEMPVT